MFFFSFNITHPPSLNVPRVWQPQQQLSTVGQGSHDPTEPGASHTQIGHTGACPVNTSVIPEAGVVVPGDRRQAVVFKGLYCERRIMYVMLGLFTRIFQIVSLVIEMFACLRSTTARQPMIPIWPAMQRTNWECFVRIVPPAFRPQNGNWNVLHLWISKGIRWQNRDDSVKVAECVAMSTCDWLCQGVCPHPSLVGDSSPDRDTGWQEAVRFLWPDPDLGFVSRTIFTLIAPIALAWQWYRLIWHL